jgi:hypothetical protein
LQGLHSVAYGFVFDELEKCQCAAEDARAILARYDERVEFRLGVVLLKPEAVGKTQLGHGIVVERVPWQIRREMVEDFAFV